MPKALSSDVVAGEEVWVCDGSTGGKAAMAYWPNAHVIVFGDPAHGDHPYLRAPGTNGVAYPSEVWRAMAPYVVDKLTGATITRWLQDHNSGRTVIRGVTVSIAGPIASVEQGTARPAGTGDQPTPRTSPVLNWHPTNAGLRRDLAAALSCTVRPGEGAWVCSGSVGGASAAASWPERLPGQTGRFVPWVAFGDSRHLGEGYLRSPGTSGVAYPSQAWQAIAPYVVSPDTAATITSWLQTHNSGRTTIDGIVVEINGPVASVQHR